MIEVRGNDFTFSVMLVGGRIRKRGLWIMKKILGLVFSNRRLGNSEILVKEIMRSIPDDGSRELIRVTDL